MISAGLLREEVCHQETHGTDNEFVFVSGALCIDATGKAGDGRRAVGGGRRDDRSMNQHIVGRWKTGRLDNTCRLENRGSDRLEV